GLNGLAGGVSLIAFAFIIYTAFLPWVRAYESALLSAIMIGILSGFLPFNFWRGSIFMGDSGSNFLGYLLAVASILGGAKLATAFLVLGLPILDGIWVILRRLREGRNIFLADKTHFHHRLLRLGLSEKQTVVFFWLIALLFGLLVLSASSQVKFYGFAVLTLSCFVFFALLDIIERKQK
ncbi:undecaprenyl/decaprenyl-phosphate alpha-N-acetylglucosaminyl 1-phosphate transferase, partial [bacterium]|nr:undecaprenyl/decaprenyl-phosphate alpha-N-acetylglucosaminyl 1-phosphate transferase [bacterium]